ncbi:MAG TPA: DMT family transporter [Candidatus Saccharimonadales bacterium]|nr:DMT family transporter [Candidatus Saccharimonadales bacterium]
MNSTVLIALVAGLGSMVGWGTADFFAKKTIDKLGDVQTLFWQQLIGVAPLIILFAAHPYWPHLARFDWLFMVLLGATSGLSYLPLYTGFGKGQVSLLSPVFASYSVLVVGISILFLGEKLSLGRAVAIAITVLGILLISTDLKDLRISARKHAFRLAGLPEVAFAVVVYSVWLVFLDRFLQGKDWVFFMLFIRAFSSATLLLYSRARKVVLPVKDKSLWKYLVGIGVFDVAAFGFVSYGFSHTEFPSLIAVLSATFSLPTILLARLFLGERINKQQVVAALIILLGIVLITLA